jgi:hypothetical protein
VRIDQRLVLLPRLSPASRPELGVGGRELLLSGGIANANE